MALPRVNETLNFTMKIPSTGKTVKYRPYLVKEEKILLQAFESKDTKTCLRAMCDTIEMCLDAKENLDVKELATFDIEYMFTQLRAKSVGEVSDLLVKCKECEESNEIQVDLDKLVVDVNEVSNIIAVNEDISVELRYPTYKSLLNGDLEMSSEDPTAIMDLLASSLVAVLTEEERIDCDSQSSKEVGEFLDSMTANQLKEVSSFFEKMPTLNHDVVFDCKKCGTHNELKLEGLSDFF